MFLPNPTQQLPIHTLEADPMYGNSDFRVYEFEGVIPHQSELLNPHRKNHYLVVLVRSGSGRQWVDLQSYELKPNTVYFSKPGQVIVKEELTNLFSTGIAFTDAFLALNDNTALKGLPLLQNKANSFELPLTDAEIAFVEEVLARISNEYRQRGEWQQRMLSAHLTVLLTYLSRIYSTRFEAMLNQAEQSLLQKFQELINEKFRELHEVADYASLLNLSAGHLSETVKLQSGRPAIKHIHDRLVLEARRLLFHSDDSLKEIAFELGFSDASYFNRFFKRETQVTPAEFRTATRKMYQ